LQFGMKTKEAKGLLGEEPFSSFEIGYFAITSISTYI
jgi:hypothetical protein